MHAQLITPTVTTAPTLERYHTTYGCGHGGTIAVPPETSEQDARDLADLMLCRDCQDDRRHEYRDWA